MRDEGNSGAVALTAYRGSVPAARVRASGSSSLAHLAPLAVAVAVGMPVLADSRTLGSDVLALFGTIRPGIGIDHLRQLCVVAVADCLSCGVVGLAIGVVAVAEEVAIASKHALGESDEHKRASSGKSRELHDEGGSE